MPTDLLWINKDALSGTLSHSSRAQRSAIQSQVQRGRPRKRKPKAKLDLAVDNLTDATGLLRPKELYDVSLRSMTATMDPFDTASVKIDSTAHGLLRYYVYYMHPAQWPNEPVVSGWAYAFKSSITQIMTTAMQDRLMMFCLLVCATCRLQYVDHLSYPNVNRNEGHYSEMALQLMRNRVERATVQGSNDLKSFLQCVSFLTAAESYREDFAAARTHLQAAYAVADQQIGGIKNLEDRHLQGQLLMGDLFLACVKVKACMCDCFFDPGPASFLQLQIHELSKAQSIDTASAFMKHDWLADSTQLIDLIEAISETYQVKTRLYAPAMSPKRMMETSHWITKRNMAVRHKLLALEHLDFRTDILRVALIMWTLLAMNITGRIKTVKLMASTLRSMLLRIEHRDFHCCEELLLWVLFVGFGCSPEGSELASWFIGQIKTLDAVHTMITAAELSGRALIDVLEEFQREYLYATAVQRTITQRLAENLQMEI